MGISDFLFGSPRPKNGQSDGRQPSGTGPVATQVPAATDTKTAPGSNPESFPVIASTRNDRARRPEKSPKEDIRAATKEDIKTLMVLIIGLGTKIEKTNDNFCIGVSNIIDAVREMRYLAKEVNLEDIAAKIPTTVEPRLAEILSKTNSPGPAAGTPDTSPATTPGPGEDKTKPKRNHTKLVGKAKEELLARLARGREEAAKRRAQGQSQQKPEEDTGGEALEDGQDQDSPRQQPASTG